MHNFSTRSERVSKHEGKMTRVNLLKRYTLKSERIKADLKASKMVDDVLEKETKSAFSISF